MVASHDVLYGIAGLAIYQALRAAARFITKQIAPDFYTGLKQSSASRFRAYFVFPVGFVLTAATTPVCLAAFSSTDPDIDRSGSSSSSTRTLSAQERVCLGSRAVLWVSELPLLSYSPDYVAHHVLSLSSLAAVLMNGQPLRPLYLIYAGLVTELWSDTTALLRFHGLDHKTSRVYAVSAFVNVVGMILLRAVPALVFAVWYILPALPPVQVKLYMAAIIFYCGWLLRLSFKQISALGLVQVKWTRPACVRLADRLDVSLFSIVLGVAIAVVQALTVVIYSSRQDMAPSKAEISGMAVTGAGASVTGLVGAYVWNWWMQLSAAPMATSDIQSNGKASTAKVLTRESQGCAAPRPTTRFIRGISIQGAILFAVLWVLLSPTLPESVDKSLLISSMAISFPLGEALGRVGCYLAGCCGSEPSQDSKAPHPPVQLLSSVNNAITFAVTIAMLVTGYLDIHKAGICAVMANASIRLSMNSLRSDIKSSFSVMNVFAYHQLAASSVLFTFMAKTTGVGYVEGILETVPVFAILLLLPHLSKHIWLGLSPLLTQGYCTITTSVPWLRRPIVHVYGFGVCVFSISYLGDRLPQNTFSGPPKAVMDHTSPFLILTEPAIAMSTLASAILPSLLVSI